MIMKFLRTKYGKLIGDTPGIVWLSLCVLIACLFKLIGILSKPIFFVMLTIGIGLMVFSTIYDFYVYTYMEVFPIPLVSNKKVTELALIGVKGIGYGSRYGKKYQGHYSTIEDCICDFIQENHEYVNSENIYGFAHKLEDFMKTHDMAEMLSSVIPDFFLEQVMVSIYDKNKDPKPIMMIEWNTFTGERTSNWEIETRRKNDG